jgi:hypothetical protein
VRKKEYLIEGEVSSLLERVGEKHLFSAHELNFVVTTAMELNEIVIQGYSAHSWL